MLLCILFGEANQSEYTNFLKIGTTALVLDMIGPSVEALVSNYDTALSSAEAATMVAESN